MVFERILAFDFGTGVDKAIVKVRSNKDLNSVIFEGWDAVAIVD